MGFNDQLYAGKSALDVGKSLCDNILEIQRSVTPNSYPLTYYGIWDSNTMVSFFWAKNSLIKCPMKFPLWLNRNKSD